MKHTPLSQLLREGCLTDKSLLALKNKSITINLFQKFVTIEEGLSNTYYREELEWVTVWKEIQ